MNRGLGVSAFLLALGGMLAVGCAVKKLYTPPPEQIPAAADVSGVRVTIEDARPEQDRQPFTGPVCLYHPGRVKPSPWDQLVDDTKLIVAAMPDKPERVEIAVTAFRLVQKEDPAENNGNPTPGQPTPGGGSGPGAGGMGMGKGKGGGGANNSAPGQSPPKPLSQLTPGKGSVQFGFLDAHPPGASCAVRATVRFVYPGGREQKVNVDRMAFGENLSGTKYLGDAIDNAARSAIRLYGQQVRQAVGLPPDG